VDFAQWTGSQRWRYALKPASWPKLLVPCALGQVLGAVSAGRLEWRALLLGLGFVVCDLVFIVCLNDWGDQAVDRLKRQMFPNGCSPKTIPDGILPASALLKVGLGAGLAAAALCVGGQLWFAARPDALGDARPGLAGFGVASLLIFVAYSLPPLKLNYRGGGELLEMLGVGVALPWLNFYMQRGALCDRWLWPLAGFALLSLASAVASGLSDEVSDREGGKRTLASLAGNRVTRRAAEGALLLGAAAWFVSDLVALKAGYVGGAGALVALVYAARALRVSPGATTSEFAAQGEYKRLLHAGVWLGALALCAAALVWAGLRSG